MTFRAAACCGIILLCLQLGWCSVRGEEPAALNYIRLHVPEDRRDDLGKVYLPLKTAKFEALLSRWTRKHEGSLQPQIELATYQAQFDGQNLVNGQAVLRIRREGEAAAFLSLGECNLAVRSANWQSDPPRSARLGGNSVGQMGVVVDNPVDLKLDWQINGETRPGQPTEFDLVLPPALVSRLTISAAANLRLQVSEGYAWEETTEPVGEQRKWQVSLGGRQQVQLKFVPYAHSPAIAPRVAWRESLAYDISLSSLECQANWSLDVSDAPLPQLTLRGEKGTSLSEVRVGDRSLPWSLDSTASGWTAVVDLPEPFLGPGRQVIVRMLAPAKISGKQKLPRVLLEKGHWQEGESLVRVAAPLRVEDATIAAGRPLGFTLDATTGTGEQLRFQHFTREATPELTLGRRQNTLRLLQATLVQIEASQMNATVQGEAETTGGNRFSLEAELPRDWVIDSVATVPADALEDRVISIANERTQRLEMRLRHPASDTHRVRFEIRAHCARPAEGSSLGINMLRVVSFRDAEVHKLVAVDILDPTLQLQLAGDSLLARQAAEDLTDEEASLLSSTGTLLFRDDERADSLLLTLERRRARFAAATSVQVTVVPSHLYYRLAIRCTPEGTPPRRLLVHLPVVTTGEFEWSGSETLGELTARRVANVNAGDSEDWLLEWSRTPSGPFEIIARFSRGFEAPQQLPLASLPEATSQGGLVEIYSAHAGIFALAADEVDSLPIVPAGDETSRMRARLRYEPTQIPQVMLSPTAKGSGLPLAQAKRLRQLSRLGLDGSGVHRLQLEVLHDGGSSLRFRLPKAQLLQVLGDGEELEAEARTTDGSDWHSVRLPGERRRVELQITYRTPVQASRWLPWQTWHFYPPEFDAPVEFREWTALLPPGLKFSLPLSQPQPATDILAATDLPTNVDEWQPTGGWSSSVLPWPSQQGARLDVVRPAALSALRLACMLVFAGAILILGWQKQLWILPCLLILCGSLALVPTWLTWGVQGLAWGVIAAIVCELLLRRVRPAEVPAPVTQVRSSIVMATVLVIVAGLLPLSADEKVPTDGTTNSKEAKKEPLLTMVVLVDKEGKPIDDFVYLDPRFHALLTRAEGSETGPELRWLLRSAEYRAYFKETSEGMELQAVHGDWNLDVLHNETRVQLPLAAEDYPAFSAELNGREVVLDWDRERKRASLLIPQTGEHRLSVKFRPRVALQPSGFETEFHVPASPLTRIIVEAPAESRDVECFAAGKRFVRRRTEPATTFVAGGTKAVKLQWASADQERKLPMTLGEQLCWWRLRPNAVTVDACFRLRPDEGKITSFAVVTDPRLRWRPAMDSTLKGVSQPSADGTKLEWTFTLPEPSDRDVVIPLTFQWLGLSGIGSFRPALVELQCTRLERRWSAVSASLGSSALGTVAPGTAEPMAVGDFLGGWSDPAVVPPEIAFRGTNANETWSVELRPTESLPIVTERLQLGCQRDRVRLQYVAEIKGGATRRLLHRLKVPAGLVIESVSIAEARDEIPCEWTSPKQNQLSIIAEAGDERELRTLTIVGRLPPLSNGPIPRLAMLDCEIEASKIEFYRGNDVNLTTNVAAGFTEQQDIAGTNVPAWGRGVTTLVAAAAALRDQSSPGVVSQTLNQPQVAGELRLLMERAGMGWSSRAELTFEVQEGELDELRMEIPQEWADVKPQGTDLEIELRKLPGQPRQHLILRPLKPWTGTQTLELRGMLATTDGGVRVPEVRVLDYDDWKRFVVLPTRFEKQRIRWTLNGLENVAWPKEEMPPVNQELYRLTGTRYSAVIEDVEYDVGQPGVLLAEAVIRVHEHDDLWGELAWELIPNGERSCTIVMSPALHLLHVQLDGSSAVVQVQTEGTWRVNLASHDLPQRVTVAFSAPVPEPQTMLELPTLRGLAVEKTSWIVQGKRSASSQPGAERALTQEAMQQLTESLEAQANALKIAGGTELTNESPEFAADWFQARHLQWQRTQLSLQHMLEQGRVPGDLNTRIKAAEVLWEQGTLLFQQPAAVAGIEPSLTTIPLRQCQLYAGWMPRQVIDVSTPPSSLQNRTWLWGALLLLVGIGGCWFLARPRVIAANLSAVGMLAGCGAVAVLALQPTWIGILLLAVAAVWQVSQRKLTVRRAISR